MMFAGILHPVCDQRIMKSAIMKDPANVLAYPGRGCQSLRRGLLASGDNSLGTRPWALAGSMLLSKNPMGELNMAL
jgi:hypothetical protein